MVIEFFLARLALEVAIHAPDLIISPVVKAAEKADDLKKWWRS